MTASIDLTAKLENGIMWVPTTVCPICGSIKAACFSLETATPDPSNWCSLLEDALELRGWRRWAARKRRAEAKHPWDYRLWFRSTEWHQMMAAKFRPSLSKTGWPWIVRNHKELLSGGEGDGRLKS